MEAFFAAIPDSFKLRLLDGTVLHDTAILPGFIPPEQAHAAWAGVCARRDCDASQPLALTFEDPKWVTGESKELNYRGHPIKRDKMWFQRDMSHMLRYGYTGWSWAVSAGTYRLGTIPALEALVKTMDTKLGLAHPHNHWIVTRYQEGKDNIGLHSDKTKDWTQGSAFAVIKLGAPRPFVFTQQVDGKDVKIFEEVLQPGTAVVVGYAANGKVKHGVPAVPNCEPSGSIVGRAIETKKPWPEVHKKIAQRAAKSAEDSLKRKRADFE